MRNLVHNNGIYELTESNKDTLMIHGILRVDEGGDFRLATVDEMQHDPGAFINNTMASNVWNTIATILLNPGEDADV